MSGTGERERDDVITTPHDVITTHHGSQLRAEVVEEVKVQLEGVAIQEYGSPSGGYLDCSEVVC